MRARQGTNSRIANESLPMETNLKSFRSDRKFSVFSYGISHGPLLLRSGKTNEHHTRIDVLILDVRAKFDPGLKDLR